MFRADARRGVLHVDDRLRTAAPRAHAQRAARVGVTAGVLEEIAQQLDLPIGTVKGQLFKARYLLGSIVSHLKKDEI